MEVAKELSTGFDDYLLTVELRETSETLGEDVEVLHCRGRQFEGLAKGVGKRIALEPKHAHNAVTLNTGIVSRCREQCDVMRRVSHNNITKFLGVDFQEKNLNTPILRLVTEFFPISLTSCIAAYDHECRDILPKEISHSILHDVAKGLSYLHSQAPPFIHRNLHSNNILLTMNMTAKITDIGVAKILKHVKYPTKKPGNTDFMAPEAQMENPRYDTSIDEFAYGVVMIHVFSREWPAPKRPPTKIDYQSGVGLPVVVTEDERRREYLEKIKDDNPLKAFAKECINNDRTKRPNAGEIVKRLSEITNEFPASADHRSEVCKVVLPGILQIGCGTTTTPGSTITKVQGPESTTSRPNQDPRAADSTVNNDKGVLGEVPTLKELTLIKYANNEDKLRKEVRIIDDAKHEWRTIANLICSDHNRTTTLSQQFGGDPGSCFQQLLIECFINNKPLDYKHNWSGFIELLGDAKLEMLAKNVEEALHLRTTVTTPHDAI